MSNGRVIYCLADTFGSGHKAAVCRIISFPVTHDLDWLSRIISDIMQSCKYVDDYTTTKADQMMWGLPHRAWGLRSSDALFAHRLRYEWRKSSGRRRTRFWQAFKWWTSGWRSLTGAAARKTPMWRTEFAIIISVRTPYHVILARFGMFQQWTAVFQRRKEKKLFCLQI